MSEAQRPERSPLAQREKYWNELLDSEKIERMRGIVLQQGRELALLRKAVDMLVTHTHDASGSPAVGIRDHLREELHNNLAGFGFARSGREHF